MKNIKSPFLLITSILFLTACGAPQKQQFIEGKVKKEVIAFAPKISGRILDIYVTEGQTVAIGDTLAVLDVPEVEAKMTQALGSAQAAKMQSQMAQNGATPNQLKQLRAKQKGLQQQYEYASKSYERSRNMFNDSLISPQTYDEVSAKYEGSKAQLDAVNAELNEVANGTRYEQIGMAVGQETRAKGAIQEVQVAASERYIIATNAMEIETISLRKGELATAGYPLFSGYIPQSIYCRFTIPESQIGNFEKGMDVQMKTTFGTVEFEGNIQTIKQLTKYADITTAFPDFNPAEAIYEIKVMPNNQTQISKLLMNANVVITESNTKK